MVSGIRMAAFKIFLAIHIFFGAVALVIAPLAMVTVKGGLWHRRWGQIYFWAMAGVALTAAILCWLRTGIFLFLIAILSFYLALTGYRVLQRKAPGAKADWLDFGAAGVMSLAGAGLIGLGVVAGPEGGRWVKVIFGLISLGLGVLDLVSFFRPAPDKRAWFYFHMSRFLGAYVATVTAFSVVNFQFLPYYWRWLWPTVVGTAGIRVWRRYYRLREK